MNDKEGVIVKAAPVKTDRAPNRPYDRVMEIEQNIVDTWSSVRNNFEISDVQAMEYARQLNNVRSSLYRALGQAERVIAQIQSKDLE